MYGLPALYSPAIKNIYLLITLRWTNAHFPFTHERMMMSLDCPSPHRSQQRAALLLHDAEVGDDGPDDEHDEEQATWLGFGSGSGSGFGFGFEVRGSGSGSGFGVRVSRPPVAEARKTGEMSSAAVSSVGIVCGLGLGLGLGSG